MPKISSQKVFAMCPSTMLDGSTLRIYEELMTYKKKRRKNG
jgi:hypothetical protein